MIKCSNGSDMCPKHPSRQPRAAALEGCRGHDHKMLGAHSLPPSLLQSVLSRGQIADDNGSVRAFVKEATFNLSSSLFRLSGFLMTDGEARKGGGREGREEAHSARPSGGGGEIDQVARPPERHWAGFNAVDFCSAHFWSGKSRAAGKAICDAARFEGEKRGRDQRQKEERGAGRGECNSIILNES